ncbi:MAG: choice-of-anchor P family protein [Actinomycetota bacterium]|jgi:hypothetical protein
MLALLPLGTGAGADPTFVAGSGRARASLFEIVPRTGGLEIPINFGKALVTYQGFSATATSGGVKPPSQNAADGDCGGAQPPGGGDGGGGGAPAPPKPGGGSSPTQFPFVSTLSVSTGDEDAEKGRQIDQGHFPDGSPITGRLEHQEVKATADPSAWAATTSGRLAFGPLIEVVNGRTEAETGIVDGKARVAHAVTTMDQLNLLGGLITLIDARWEATQRTGDGPRADGTFTVGSVLLQGKPLPAPPAPPAGLPGGGSAPPLPDPLTVLNTAIAPSGLAIESPKLDTAGGVARVSPMTLRIADSALGRALLAPLVTSLQPFREAVVGGLLAISCDFGAAVTVADVAAGVLTGTGGIRFDFGGVSATTEGEVYDNPFAGGVGDGSDVGDGGFGDGGEVPGLPEIPAPATAFTGPTGDSGLSSGTGGDLGAPYDTGLGRPSRSGAGPDPGSDAAVGDNPAGDEVAFSDPAALFGPASRHEPGRKGGRALVVAALALLVVAALAAADAFHLRRASRSIS